MRQVGGARPAPEAPDVQSSSPDYARRFGGEVGRWFLALQANLALHLLRHLSPGSRVLDVGGGHAQLVAPYLDAGFEPIVFGSPSASRELLDPWLRDGSCAYATGELLRLPFPDRSFDAALSFRLLPHLSAWREFLGELCRVSRASVLVDYPSLRSANAASRWLFGLKRRVEPGTRSYRLFTGREVAEAFAEAGFSVGEARPQFLFPMALHRLLGSALLARALEAPGRALGLTRALGSPVIVRADREA